MDNTNSSGNFYEQHEYLQNKELLKLLSWFLVSFVVILILTSIHSFISNIFYDDNW